MTERISYSRLFTVGDYQNEKISISVEIDPAVNNADLKMVELFEKVTNIHKAFALYRFLFKKVENLEGDVDRDKNSISGTKAQITKIEDKIKAAREKLEKAIAETDPEDLDEEMQYCNVRGLKGNLAQYKDNLESAKKRLDRDKKKLVKRRGELEQVEALLKEAKWTEIAALKIKR
jgi:predicted  nucleic acid-binding Zn-ribbon protein